MPAENTAQIFDETFTSEMKQQLSGVFSKMQQKLSLRLYLDNRPVSSELEAFITQLAALTDKLKELECKKQHLVQSLADAERQMAQLAVNEEQLKSAFYKAKQMLKALLTM